MGKLIDGRWVGSKEPGLEPFETDLLEQAVIAIAAMLTDPRSWAPGLVLLPERLP